MASFIKQIIFRTYKADGKKVDAWVTKYIKK